MSKRSDCLRSCEVIVDTGVGAELLLLPSTVFSEGNDGSPEEFELFWDVGSVSLAERSVGFD